MKLSGQMFVARVCVVVLAVGLYGAAARAVDSSKAFIDALSENRMHDVALDYLDWVGQTKKAGPEFLQRIDYEAGLIHIQNSMLQRSISERQKSLVEAKTRLDKFLGANASHPLVPSAKRMLAEVVSKNAQIKTEQAEQSAKTPEEKTKLLSEARSLFQEAQKVFELLEQQALEKLKAMPNVLPSDDPRKEEQEQLRKDLLESRLAQATAVYEIAKTFPAGSKEQKDHLTAAAKKYNEFYKKYNTMIAGLYARSWEGRCFREMGDVKQAFTIFEELLVTQPDDPEPFRVLKDKVRVMALETALLPTSKKYTAAVAMYQDWLSKAKGRQETSPDGLAIRYLAGEAALEHLRTLKENDAARRDFIRTAKDAFTFVARFPGEYQQKARAKLNDPLMGGGEKAAEPTNCAEARDRARDAVEQMSAAQAALEEARASNNAEETKRQEKAIVESREQAMRYFEMALRMAPRDVSVDDLNSIRYFLSYLHYSADDLPEAAILGEFLARRYPSSGGGKSGAKIALAAYSRMASEGEGDVSFEQRKLVEIAQYIAARWAGQPEADTAWMTLIGTAVRARDLAVALDYLSKIPLDAPKRGDAEQMVGQLIWSEYLRRVRLPDEERPPTEELDQLKAQAQKVLADGLERVKKAGMAQMTPAIASSVLYLAQIYVETNQAEEAVKLLEDEKLGIKSLVEKKDPSVQKAGFAVETLRVALRAYVATQQLEKAEKAMNDLERQVRDEGDAEAGKKLTQIYIRLGKELEEQLGRLRKEQKTEQMAKVAQGFEMFLSRIAQRDKGNNFNSLNWVATTFAGLAEGVDTGGTKLTPEAERYYRGAAEAYDKILTRLPEKEFGAPENAANAMKIRKARVLRRLGEYSDAIKLLLDVLKEKQTVIDAQIEAAYTMQAWGNEDPRYYDIAISGSRKQKEIWGWGQLARKVQTVEGFLPVFHEARYNLALCRFKQAQQEKDEKRRSALVDQAIKDIEIIFRLYPEMGGKDWADKYDALLKNVQKFKGVKPAGLEGLRQAAAEAEASALKAEAASAAK